VVPGLGQAYNRRRRLALGLFIPFALVAAAAALAVWAIPGARLIATAIVPRNLDLLLNLNLTILAWRLVALSQAFFDDRFELRPGRLGLGGLALAETRAFLLALSLFLALGYLVYTLRVRLERRTRP